MESAQLLSSILGECTSYQIAGTLTKDGSSTITEEIAESLLKVSPPCWLCEGEGQVQEGCLPPSKRHFMYRTSLTLHQAWCIWCLLAWPTLLTC